MFLREELFMELTPMGDDIWFYFMVIFNDKHIRQIKKAITNLCFVNPYREYGITEGTTLTQQNVGENKNDEQINKMLSYYNISEQQFIDYISGKNESIL